MVLNLRSGYAFPERESYQIRCLSITRRFGVWVRHHIVQLAREGASGTLACRRTRFLATLNSETYTPRLREEAITLGFKVRKWSE